MKKRAGISRDEIVHLAELSSLSLSEAEIVALTGDLSRILEYVGQLDELEVANVEPTFQVFEMENVWRADEVAVAEASRAELLAIAPEAKDNQIKVPKVL